jgi:acetyl-CoA C-acetyltransferase
VRSAARPTDVVAVAAARTPSGKFGGMFRETPVVDLGALTIEAALTQAGVAARDLDEVILGCCRQAGSGANPARTAASRAGVPARVPASTLATACAAGTRAVIDASRMLRLGEARFVLAGGMDSMSRVPFLVNHARWREATRAKDTVDGLDDCHDPLVPVGGALRALVRAHGVGRAAMDRYALESHRRAARAADAGHLEPEMVRVTIRIGDVEGFVRRDETIRRDTSLAKLVRLPVLVRGAALTAGNATPFADGAAALLLTTRAVARAHGLRPLFRVVASAVAAVPHESFHEGPSVSLPMALERAGLALRDLDVVEINETFAGMAIVNQRRLRCDPERLNPHGGTIAFGHPSGCTGARMLVSLHQVLRARDRELGGMAISGAGGVTAAVVVRRES